MEQPALRINILQCKLSQFYISLKDRLQATVKP